MPRSTRSRPLRSWLESGSVRVTGRMRILAASRDQDVAEIRVDYIVGVTGIKLKRVATGRPANLEDLLHNLIKLTSCGEAHAAGQASAIEHAGVEENNCHGKLLRSRMRRASGGWASSFGLPLVGVRGSCTPHGCFLIPTRARWPTRNGTGRSSFPTTIRSRSRRSTGPSVGFSSRAFMGTRAILTHSCRSPSWQVANCRATFFTCAGVQQRFLLVLTPGYWPSTTSQFGQADRSHSDTPNRRRNRPLPGL